MYCLRKYASKRYKKYSKKYTPITNVSAIMPKLKLKLAKKSVISSDTFSGNLKLFISI